MSDKQPFCSGWRARVHYLTRDLRFLLRSCTSILAVGLIIASAIILSSQESTLKSRNDAPVSSAQILLRRDYLELLQVAEPAPRRLALWLRRQLALIPRGDTVETYVQSLSSGLLAGNDVTALLKVHATAQVPAERFRDYLAAALGGDEKAQRRLEQAAHASPPLMLANEFLGSVQKRRGAFNDAMHSFFTEGVHYAEATASREEALRLAVSLRDVEQLQAIAANPGWIDACQPLLQHHAGALLGDIWMQWCGLLRHRLRELPSGTLVLAFFAASIWFLILVQHRSRVRWPWARSMLPLIAGVCSVWPTLSILAYQEYTQGMTADAPFPSDLLYFISGVGLREEGCKLLAFALFLPWLLWRRTPGLALLTGAFVGLGFSLEENIGYFQDYGGAIAWARLLSANFLHIALSGICAHSLYGMFATRFAHAERFIITFIAVIVAHGAYDWLGTGTLGDNGWLSIIVLVLCASHFIDLLAQETRPERRTIAPAAIFTLGSAMLVAVSFILGALATRSMIGVAEAGQECLGMFPIAILYWRRFEDA